MNSCFLQSPGSKRPTWSESTRSTTRGTLVALLLIAGAILAPTNNSIAALPSTGYAFVVQQGSEEPPTLAHIYVVKLADNTLLIENHQLVDLQFDAEIGRMKTSPDGRRLYIGYFVFFRLSQSLNMPQCRMQVQGVPNSDFAPVSIFSDPGQTNTSAIVDSPDGSRVYWATTTGHAIEASRSHLSVCDLRNSSSVPAKTIEFRDAFIRGLAVSPDGSYLYVPISNRSSGTLTSTLSVYDIDLNLLNSVTVVDNNEVFAAVVSPDGSRVYVTSKPFGSGLNYMYVINVDTSDVQKPALTVLNASNPISLPGSSRTEPAEIAVTPNGASVYVLNAGLFSDPSNVAVINASDLSATPQTIDAGSAQHMAMTPDGKSLYLPSGDNILTIINTANNSTTEVNPRDNTFDGDQSIYFTSESPIALAIPAHVLTFYLSNTIFRNREGTPIGFTMGQNPSSMPVTDQLGIPRSWFSEPAEAGTFLAGSRFSNGSVLQEGASFRFVIPQRDVALGVNRTYTLAVTDEDGNAVKRLGSAPGPVLSVGPATITIPVATPVTLVNQRLKLTISGEGAGLNLGTDVSLQGTQYQGRP